MKTCLMPLISASIAIAGCLLCGWPVAAQTVTDPASAPGDAAAATTAAEMPTDLTLVANLADNRPVGQLRPMTQWSAPNDIYLDDTGLRVRRKRRQPGPRYCLPPRRPPLDRGGNAGFRPSRGRRHHQDSK